MVEYFIYRNTHRKRARTHLAECRMCDHGRWQPTDINKRGIWLGPLTAVRRPKSSSNLCATELMFSPATDANRNPPRG